EGPGEFGGRLDGPVDVCVTEDGSAHPQTLLERRGAVCGGRRDARRDVLADQLRDPSCLLYVGEVCAGGEDVEGGVGDSVGQLLHRRRRGGGVLLTGDHQGGRDDPGEVGTAVPGRQCLATRGVA